MRTIKVYIHCILHIFNDKHGLLTFFNEDWSTFDFCECGYEG